MFIVNGTSLNKSSETRCFVFESITIARVIADKLEGQRFDVEILNEHGEVVTQVHHTDPYQHLLRPAG